MTRGSSSPASDEGSVWSIIASSNGISASIPTVPNRTNKINSRRLNGLLIFNTLILTFIDQNTIGLSYKLYTIRMEKTTFLKVSEVNHYIRIMHSRSYTKNPFPKGFLRCFFHSSDSYTSRVIIDCINSSKWNQFHNYKENYVTTVCS